RTVDGGDLAGPLRRLLFRGASGHQGVERLPAETLGTDADVARQGLLEQVAGAPSALEALRRDAQAFGSAHTRGLGLPAVVAVQVGGRVGHQQVELQETAHSLISLMDAGSSPAFCSRVVR